MFSIGVLSGPGTTILTTLTRLCKIQSQETEAGAGGRGVEGGGSS